MEKGIVITSATKNKNGISAFKDNFNPFIYNIRKVSLKGRDNGLICRYNKSSGQLLTDGLSWRSYKSYSINNTELLELLFKSLG